MIKNLSVSCLILSFCGLTANAVVVSSGQPNDTAPIGQPFFDNIGNVNGSSGIYLGDRWMLTAAHVAGSLPVAPITLAGNSYSAQPGTFQRVPNPEGFGFSALTDLAVFRLTTDPGLPSIDISASVPTVGADLMMIGRGRGQAATRTYWDVVVNSGTNNDVWTQVLPGGHDREGYLTLDTYTNRWGENDVHAINQVYEYQVGPDVIDVISFTTSFDLIGKTHEAQAITGDSGGAVFVDVGGTWELAGVMVAISTFETQPSNHLVFGNQTIVADLSYYRDGILAVIPEPNSSLLCMLGSFLMIFRRNRC